MVLVFCSALKGRCWLSKEESEPLLQSRTFLDTTDCLYICSVFLGSLVFVMCQAFAVCIFCNTESRISEYVVFVNLKNEIGSLAVVTPKHEDYWLKI